MPPEHALKAKLHRGQRPAALLTPRRKTPRKGTGKTRKFRRTKEKSPFAKISIWEWHLASSKAKGAIFFDDF